MALTPRRVVSKGPVTSECDRTWGRECRTGRAGRARPPRTSRGGYRIAVWKAMAPSADDGNCG